MGRAKAALFRVGSAPPPLGIGLESPRPEVGGEERAVRHLKVSAGVGVALSPKSTEEEVESEDRAFGYANEPPDEGRSTKRRAILGGADSLGERAGLTAFFENPILDHIFFRLLKNSGNRAC
jgi:hypothetical protein